ncbi:MAG: putative conserved rane protein, partial [Mycobacterium sp.]|nr:putative conserved rane protein [Mycobacterium sp.]
MAGPIPYPDSPFPESAPQQPFPQSGPRPPGPVPYPGAVPSAYPGTLPPPVNYPKRPRRKRAVVIGIGLLVIALVAAVVTAVVLATRGGEDGPAVTDATATTAIQNYLDALAKGDDETIARNNSCGFF